MASSRIDYFLVALVALGIVLLWLASLLGASSSLAYDLYSIAAVVVFAYPAYWALNIRHLLSVRVYKNQALGLAMLSTVIALSSIPLTSSSSAAMEMSFAGLLQLLVNASFMFGLLYFIDATVLAARRSDPRRRDLFHWTKLRFLIWAWESFNVAFIFGIFAYTSVSRDYSIINQIANYGNFSYLPSLIFNLAWWVPVSIPIIVVPIALRAKDQLLRRHFLWLAVIGFAGIITVILFGTIVTPSQTAVATFISNSVLAYFTFKSMRALVPLNRLSPAILAK